jgi:hypothetical protein
MTFVERVFLWLLFMHLQVQVLIREPRWSLWAWIAIGGVILSFAMVIYRVIVPFEQPKELTVQDGLLWFLWRRRRRR